jgi:hypothetical protein
MGQRYLFTVFGYVMHDVKTLQTRPNPTATTVLFGTTLFDDYSWRDT